MVFFVVCAAFHRLIGLEMECCEVEMPFYEFAKSFREFALRQIGFDLS